MKYNELCFKVRNGVRNIHHCVRDVHFAAIALPTSFSFIFRSVGLSQSLRVAVMKNYLLRLRKMS